MDLLLLMDVLCSPFDRDAMRVRALLVASAVGTHDGAGFTQATSNAWGGTTITQNGLVIGGTRPNPLGGTDILDHLNMPTGHINASPLGGWDIQGTDGIMMGHVGSSPLDGWDVRDGHGAVTGHVGLSPFGGLQISHLDGGGHHIVPDGHGGWQSND